MSISDITTTAKFPEGVHRLAATETDGADLASALERGAGVDRAGGRRRTRLDGGHLSRFVDASLPDYQTLIGHPSGVEVVAISGPDGLQQIAAFLQGQTVSTPFISSATAATASLTSAARI